jgi:alpha-tubulin suppressor-like RCC1 family protein
VITLTPAGGSILEPVTAVSAGSGHSLALKADGTVWAWGWNLEGQLGNGTLVNRNTAVQVLTQNGGVLLATSVSAGGEHSLAYEKPGP